MSNAYISNVSVSRYSKGGDGYGSVTIKMDNGTVNYELTQLEISRLSDVINKIVKERRSELADKVAKVDTSNLLTYEDQSKVIDAKPDPF